MGDGSVYECSNCGEEAGMHGHYNFSLDRFTCESKHGAPPQRDAMGELVVARKSKRSLLTLDEFNVKAALADMDVGWYDKVTVQDSWDKKGRIVVIEVRYHDITFEDLSRVSRALNTTMINLDNQVREGGYCETCRYSYSVTVLTVMNARVYADGSQ